MMSRMDIYIAEDLETKNPKCSCGEYIFLQFVDRKYNFIGRDEKGLYISVYRPIYSIINSKEKVLFEGDVYYMPYLKLFNFIETFSSYRIDDLIDGGYVCYDELFWDYGEIDKEKGR